MIQTPEPVYYLGKDDRAFKEVMLKESNQDLLKLILETVLDVKIEEIDYEPTELNTGNLRIKRKTLDCLLKTNEGLIGIEVNTSNKPYVHPKSMTYICDTYVATTLRRDTYTEDMQVIQINLSYGLPKKVDRKREYMMRDEKGNLFVKNLKIIEINMEKYDKKWYDKHKLEMNEEEKQKNLSLVMIGEERDNLEELSKENKVVAKYMDELDKINKDPVFIRRISYEKDQEMIFNSRMKKATEKGLSKGLKQGLEQGLEQGINQEKISIARNLLKQNVDINVISKSTGLSIEEIESIV